MILAATNTIEGHSITAYEGLVVRKAIMCANILRDFLVATSAARSNY
ncbi:heavy metal-binding domain-containing protein [Roseobacter sp. MH60115]|nr:heavy metal-binding domain-containing protein [Roseobacter sp. MH60115]